MTDTPLIDGEIGMIESFRLIESPGHRPRRINPLVDQMMSEAVWCYKKQEQITFVDLGPPRLYALEDQVKAYINLGRWLSTGIWLP